MIEVVKTLEKLQGRNLVLSHRDGTEATVEDFDLGMGQICCLHGINGIGKSVFLSLLAGHRLPRDFQIKGSLKMTFSDGSILDLTDCNSDLSAAKQAVAVVFQRLGSSLATLFDIDDLGIAGEGAVGSDEQRDERLQWVLDLMAKQTVMMKSGHARSYSETRNLELACAATTGQPLYLLDEPFQGLSYERKSDIVKLLSWLAWDQRCLVFLTHQRPLNPADFGDDRSPNNIAITEAVGNLEAFVKIVEIAKAHLRAAHVTPLVPDTVITMEAKGHDPTVCRLCNLDASKINWVVAHNGLGKSTLCAAFGGLVKNGRGIFSRFREGFHINLTGWEETRTPNPRVHVVLQNPYASFVDKQVLEDVPENIRADLGTLWEGLERQPRTFSHGQARFLQLLLIPSDAELIIFDEPTMGLAAETEAIMLEFIRCLPGFGRCVICTALDSSQIIKGEPSFDII